MRKSMRARAQSSGGMTRNPASQASLNKKQSPGLTEEASDNEYNSESDTSTAEDFQVHKHLLLNICIWNF